MTPEQALIDGWTTELLQHIAARLTQPDYRGHERERELIDHLRHAGQNDTPAQGDPQELWGEFNALTLKLALDDTPDMQQRARFRQLLITLNPGPPHGLDVIPEDDDEDP